MRERETEREKETERERKRLRERERLKERKRLRGERERFVREGRGKEKEKRELVETVNPHGTDDTYM